MPGNPDASPNFPTLLPPPVQGLAVAYLTPLMSPVPVATRLPVPSSTADTIAGFIRVETAGGALQWDDCLFNVGLIIMSYANNSDESTAETNLTRAVALAGNTQGRYITHPSTAESFYVTYSRITGLPVKSADPQTPLVRFRALVTWRIKGNYLAA